MHCVMAGGGPRSLCAIGERGLEKGREEWRVRKVYSWEWTTFTKREGGKGVWGRWVGGSLSAHATNIHKRCHPSPPLVC